MTCPVRNIVARIGKKWAVLIILLLHERKTMRFNELSHEIPDISSRVLSGTLKTLLADNIITRKVYPVVPPKVEYSLSATGKSLVPIIVNLTAWAKDNMADIMAHRRRYERAEQRAERHATAADLDA